MAQQASVAINFTTNGVPQTVGQLRQVEQAAEDAEKANKGRLLDTFGVLNQQLFFLRQNFQLLQQTAQQAYQALIGQNEELNQQILSSQSSLVANADIIQDGIKIKDNIEAIKALEEPIRNAINNIRQDSLELVGVTSQELIPVFQILATNAGAITEQSKQWGDPLKAAEKLTISFAATLGTLRVPLFQANQEIASILNGYIDQNSVLAKNLKITNEMVNQWKSQGVLVDKLIERLQPFVDGNKLAAQSVSGITSNMLEVLQETQRIATEPFYEPVVAQLQKVYDFLKQNQDTILTTAQDISMFVLELAERIGVALTEITKLIQSLVQELGQAGIETAIEAGRLAGQTLIAITKTLTTLFEVLKPIIDLTANFIQFLNDTGLSGEILLGTILLLSGAMGTLLTSITALIVPGGALFGLISSAAISIPALTAQIGLLTSSFVGLAASVVATVAPFALLLAAAGAVFALFKAEELKQANKAIEEYQSVVTQAGDASLNLAIKLREVRKELEADGVVTEEEAKRLRYLTELSKGRIETNNDLIKSLKELKGQVTNQSQRNALENQITELEVANKALEKQIAETTKGVKVQARELQDLGDAYFQLGEKVKNAKRQLDLQGAGDINQAKQAAKELQQLTQQQLELGQIALEEARERYEFIRKKTFLTNEEILAAEKALTDLINKETEVRVQGTLKAQQDIQEAIANRQLSQQTGERRLTELQIKETEIRLEQTRKAIAEEERLRGNLSGDNARKLILEAEKQETQLAQNRKKLLDLQRKEKVESINQEAKAYEESYAKREIQEEEFINATQEIKVRGFLEQKRQLQQDLDVLAKDDKVGRMRILAQQSDIEKQIYDLVRGNSKRLEAIYEGQIQRRTQIIQRETQALNAALTEQTRLLEQVSTDLGLESKQLQISLDIIDRRRNLIQETYKLEKARQNLINVTAQGETAKLSYALQLVQQLNNEQIKGTKLENDLRRELARVTGNSHIKEISIIEQRQKLEKEAFNRKVEALKLEEQQQNKLLEIEKERLKIQMQQSRIQAKQAESQAEQAILNAERQRNEAIAGRGRAKLGVLPAQNKLDVARRGGDSGEIAQAEEGLRQAEQELLIADQNVANSERLLKNSRQQLDLQKQLTGETEKQLKQEQKLLEIREQTQRIEQQTAREGLRQEGINSQNQGRSTSIRSGSPYYGVRDKDISQVAQPTLEEQAESFRSRGYTVNIIGDSLRYMPKLNNNDLLRQSIQGQINPSVTQTIDNREVVQELQGIKQSLARPNVTNQIYNNINREMPEHELIRKIDRSLSQTISNELSNLGF